MNKDKLEEIHESLVNGQRRKMVKQIDEYGTYDFWKDYANYLEYSINLPAIESVIDYFVDAVVSYH